MGHNTKTKSCRTGAHGLVQLPFLIPNRPSVTAVKRHLATAAIGLLALSTACGTVVRTDHVTTSQPVGGDRLEFVLHTDSAVFDSSVDMGSKLELLLVSQKLAADRSNSSIEYESGNTIFNLEMDSNAVESALQENVLASVAVELGIMTEQTDGTLMLASAGNLMSGTGSEHSSQAFSLGIARASLASAGFGAPIAAEISVPQPPSEATPSGAPASIGPGATGPAVPSDEDQHHTATADEKRGTGDTSATTGSDPAETGEDSSDDSFDDVFIDSSPGNPGTNNRGSTNSNAGGNGNSNSNGNAKSSSGDSETPNGDEPDISEETTGDGPAEVVETAVVPGDDGPGDDSSPGNPGINNRGSTNSNAGGNGNGNAKSSSGDSETPTGDEFDENSLPGSNKNNNRHDS